MISIRNRVIKRYYSSSTEPPYKEWLRSNKLNSILNTQLNDVDDVGWLSKNNLPRNPKHEQGFQVPLKLDWSEECEKSIVSIANSIPDPIKKGSDYEYVFVGGLWSNYAASLYFRSSLMRMNEVGLTFQRASLNTSAGVEENAEVLKTLLEEKIKTTQKKIIFIGHSKGGVDTLTMMLKYPHLQEHIGGLITMQSPLGGSPLASDFLNSSSTVRNFIAQMLEANESSALSDLTYAQRKHFFEQYPLTNLEVPLFNFATTCDVDSITLLSELYNYVSEHYSEHNDGLVIKEDAIIPGFPHAHLHGVTHLGTVFGRLAGSKYMPGDMTISLLSIFLEHIVEK